MLYAADEAWWRETPDAKDFKGLVACGGFSYGDVLGAGEGWAKSALFNERARAEFAAFHSSVCR